MEEKTEGQLKKTDDTPVSAVPSDIKPTKRKGWPLWVWLLGIGVVIVASVITVTRNNALRQEAATTKATPLRIESAQNSPPPTVFPSQQPTLPDNPVTDWASAAVYAQLPDCQGNQLLTQIPVEAGANYDPAPLGHLGATGGHAYPSDHNYLNFNTNGTYNVLSPGNIFVTKVRRINRTVNGVTTSDDSVYFMPCKQVIFYFNHIHITGTLDEAIPEQDNDSTHPCTTPVTNSPGNVTNSDCYNLASSLVALKPGDLIGTATINSNQKGWDFGALDARVPDLPLINPGLAGGQASWHGISALKAVCSFNYFPQTVQDQIFAKPSMAKRPASNKCGEIAQDLKGTIQGDWYQGAHVDYAADWTKEFGIVHDSIDPSIAVLSVGGTLGSGGMMSFKPKSSGTINIEPALTQVGPLYCFTADGTGISDFNFVKGHKILLQLMDDQTLKAEYKSGSCTGSEAFTNPVVYYR